MAGPTTSSASPAHSTDLPASPATMAPVEPPTKRRRLGHGAHGSLAGRKMRDLETSLEVDHMILDYLLYKAIEACLSNPHTSWDDHVHIVELTLQQVDEFYSLFKKRYPKYKLDPEIRFRQELLQFVTLFTQRLRRSSTTPDKGSLKRLREINRIRAYRWIEDASRQPTAAFTCDHLDSNLPLSPPELERHRGLVLQALRLPAENNAHNEAFYGTRETTSLLDLLPLLMRVSATCFDLFNTGTPLKTWMQMAVDLMLQACLEQYLVFGEHGSDAIDEAFAWGFKEETEAGIQTDDKDAERVNNMFQHEQRSEEVAGWQELKDKALEELFSHREGELTPHLLALAEHHSFSACETSVMSFLKDISRGTPKPVLLQLELGQLDGMSREETRNFIRDCGLDVKSFFTDGTVQ